jgi:hypothetical protein
MPADTPMVLVPRDAVQRLIFAADSYGVKHLDSDDMDETAEELQAATEAMKDALSASPAREGDYGPVISMETRGPVEDARRRREAEDAYYGARWAAPSPGEGDAPVAWRVIAVEDGRAIGKWSLHADAAWALEHPTLYRAEPLYLRPTPATPEGVREKVADLCGFARAREDHELIAKADAILAALQPQAQGGE